MFYTVQLKPNKYFSKKNCPVIYVKVTELRKPLNSPQLQKSGRKGHKRIGDSFLLGTAKIFTFLCIFSSCTSPCLSWYCTFVFINNILNFFTQTPWNSNKSHMRVKRCSLFPIDKLNIEEQAPLPSNSRLSSCLICMFQTLQGSQKAFVYFSNNRQGTVTRNW